MYMRCLPQRIVSLVYAYLRQSISSLVMTLIDFEGLRLRIPKRKHDISGRMPSSLLHIDHYIHNQGSAKRVELSGLLSIYLPR